MNKKLLLLVAFKVFIGILISVPVLLGMWWACTHYRSSEVTKECLTCDSEECFGVVIELTQVNSNQLIAKPNRNVISIRVYDDGELYSTSGPVMADSSFDIDASGIAANSTVSAFASINFSTKNDIWCGGKTNLKLSG
jgi:hypothetical protein